MPRTPRTGASILVPVARAGGRTGALRRPLAVSDWERLEPRSTYARLGRPLLRALLLAACLPVALFVSLPIVLVNAREFGLGGVLFRQPRIGKRGRPFWIVKFRTLRGPDGDEGTNDLERVTPFGRFLRNTHLDELPQLWNILVGEMDFVGPRPETIAIDAWARAHVSGFERRYAVLPGVTGLAQVTQGYALPERRAYRRKLLLDRVYLAQHSPALDLAILARTAGWMLRGRGWVQASNLKRTARAVVDRPVVRR